MGKALISCLPDSATTPDMTARWEATLNDICHKQSSYDAFMQPLLTSLKDLVAGSAGVQIPASLKAASPARKRATNAVKLQVKRKELPLNHQRKPPVLQRDVSAKQQLHKACI
ncbi:hypothetical protein [Aliamphritea spongicola]|nr:hypothetical protein [Aliamphritea spongicola]